MPDTVSELQIEINAKATKANDAIDRLVGKLDRLTTSLIRVNGTNLNGLANGVQRLGNSMQVMNTIKTADFTRLATNLTKLGSINVSALNSAASSMSHLTRAFNSLGTVAANAQAVGEMAKNIAKLGNKSVQTAIANIPQLAIALNNLMATLSRAPRVSQNVIQMTNALANLSSQGSKVCSVSNSIVRGLNRTSASANTARRSFGGLASAIGKFYATYFMVIRGLKGLWSSVESTADYVEAYNYFNVALGKIGSDWSHQFEQYGYDNAESYADSFEARLSERLGKLSGLQVLIGADGKGLLTESGLKNLGLNIQEITQYASQLASVTNSVGQTGEVSIAAASSFTKLAGDISSLFNVDYSAVATNLQSGLIGQSRALYKYGIDITNATLQTYAYNLGLSKSVSEMTQAEKMQLRMLAILDQSKVSWGDLANTINSPSNMIRQFTNNLKETGMVLGQLFIPVLQKVLPVINGVTIAIKRLFVNIANLLGIKIDFDAFGQGYSNMEDGIEDISSAYDDATSAAKKFKTVTLGIDELNINAPQEDSGSAAGGIGGGIDLTDEILEATSEYERVWQEAYDRMENKAQEFANRFSRIFEPIKDLFEDISIGDWFSVGGDVSGIATKIFNFLSSSLKKIDWNKVGQNIGKFLSGINWTGILMSVGNFFETLVDSAIDLWKGAFDAAPFETAILSALALLKFTGAGNAIWGALENSLSATLLGKSIGFVPTVTIAAVTWVIGFNVGKSLGEALFPDDAVWYEDFTFFGDNGFFKIVTEDWKITLDALASMATDFANNPLIAVLTNLLAGQFVAPALRIYAARDEIKIVLTEIAKLMQEWWTNDVEPWFTSEKWGSLFQNAKDSFSTKTNEIISDWKSNISSWWNEDVAPWFTKERWGEMLKNIRDSFLYEASEITSNWNSTMESWWALYVAPWFTSEKWGALLQSVSSVFSKKTTEIYSDWNINTASWWNKNVIPWFSLEKWTNAMQGIKEAFSDVFTNSANIAIDIFNNLIGWINEKMHFEWDAITIAGEEIVPSGSVQLFTIPEIPKFELGGFPEDGWFRASHGEIMGQFDNGQSVVANNMQIVDGISLGVREAVAEVLVPYLSDISRNTRETADKDMSVNIGDRDIARANARGSRLIGNFIVT